MRRISTLATLYLLLSAAAQAQCPVGAAALADFCANPEFQSCTMPVKGVDRNYCIHAPTQPATDLPVVFGFHGGNQRARHQVEIWDKHTEQGMVLVAPEALESDAVDPAGNVSCNRKWRSIGGNIPTWADFSVASTCQVGVATDNMADLDFINELASGIRNSRDVANFYATGFSSGAGMVYQMYITKPFATEFRGFAAISNVMGQAKQDAALGGSVGVYSANTDTAKPFMFVIGTGDKVNVPLGSMIDNAKNCMFTTGCTAIGGGKFDCTDVVGQALFCWKSNVIWGVSNHKLVTNRADTIKWFVDRNETNPVPIISLYPNLGSYGNVAADDSVDKTMSLRQDYLSQSADSAAFTAVTVVDGAHVHPGKNGDYPPCQNCDIDITEQILQFWRANADFRSVWQ